MFGGNTVPFNPNTYIGTPAQPGGGGGGNSSATVLPWQLLSQDERNRQMLAPFQNPQPPQSPGGSNQETLPYGLGSDWSQWRGGGNPLTPDQSNPQAPGAPSPQGITSGGFDGYSQNTNPGQAQSPGAALSGGAGTNPFAFGGSRPSGGFRGYGERFNPMQAGNYGGSPMGGTGSNPWGGRPPMSTGNFEAPQGKIGYAGQQDRPMWNNGAGYQQGGMFGPPAGATDWEGQAKQLYRQYLGREADPSGLQNWTQNLKGGMSLDTAANAFRTSQEAQQKGGPTNIYGPGQIAGGTAPGAQWQQMLREYAQQREQQMGRDAAYGRYPDGTPMSPQNPNFRQLANQGRYGGGWGQ